MDLHDIQIILEYGEKCGEKRRKAETIEFCTSWKGSKIKIILINTYSGWVEEPVWLIKTVIEKR